MSVRDASLDEAALIASIAAAAFYDDPVMSWAMPDDAARLGLLEIAFTGLARDFLPDRGVVHVLDDASVAYWRAPAFTYEEIDRAETLAQDAPSPSPFPADVGERMRILGELMHDAHPHETPHWYLNVIATRPDRRSQGLGARILAPVLEICDRDGVAAYLESSNPRNMTLYRRHGFEETGEIELPDGPSLYAMWREPR